jgi:hypothetical protein
VKKKKKIKDIFKQVRKSLSFGLAILLRKGRGRGDLTKDIVTMMLALRYYPKLLHYRKEYFKIRRRVVKLQKLKAQNEKWVAIETVKVNKAVDFYACTRQMFDI